MWYTYIIKSKSCNKYYIGYTENLEKRLREHNGGKTKSIKAFIPFDIIYYESYNNKPEAYKRERKIKKYKGGEAFKKLINNTERCQSG